jgi:hypothetical protein
LLQMRLPNQRSRALLKRVNGPIVCLLVALFSLPLIYLSGCGANGSPSMEGIKDFFTGSTPVETPTPPTAIPTATPSPTPVPTPVATTDHPRKKNERQARAASQNAAAASKNAANPSAASASKQAAVAAKHEASVANHANGTPNDVSLENSAPTAATPAPLIKESGAAESTPSTGGAAEASAPVVGAMTPTLSSPGMDSSASSSDANPPKAVNLIQEVDGTERRVDRKNLSADDSQRDILAQRLIQEAKKSLADHDSVAAISLATKASTLLAPLPKLADSTIPPTP